MCRHIRVASNSEELGLLGLKKKVDSTFVFTVLKRSICLHDLSALTSSAPHSALHCRQASAWSLHGGSSLCLEPSSLKS